LTIWLVRSDKSFEFLDAAVGASWGISFAGFLPADVDASNRIVHVHRRGIVEFAEFLKDSVRKEAAVRWPRRGIHFEGFDPGSE
jgi:hypothetical protein